MAHLVGLIVSRDEGFRAQLGRMLRSAEVPVSVLHEESAPGTPPDLIVVDARDAAPAMTKIGQLRAASLSAAIFAVARVADPNLILEAMRAGANEFFIWPPPEDNLRDAISRAAARRETLQGAKPTATTLAFFGAKGGVGTTTIAVNFAVELARLSKRPAVIVDLQPGLGEVGLFLGLRSKYTLVDALDNLQRFDRDFLRELIIKHKSGLDILVGSDQFDRPGPADGSALEELLRLLAKEYEFIVTDAGNQMNACAVAAMYTADQVFLVANPNVPSIRNVQRLLERLNQLGACGERVRFLLNQMEDPLPIPLKQIEGAVGHPVHHTFSRDHEAVSTALNSGVPLTMAGNSEIAKEFNRFARLLLSPAAEEEAPSTSGRGLGLSRIASLW